MPESVTSPSSPVELIRSASDTERDIHRELLFDNIEFLIDVLTAAHAKRQRMDPVGCVGSTPERLARKRGKYTETCRYATVKREKSGDEDHCSCEDPLYNSDDPLDTVAAVVLSGPVESPAQRFFERWSRDAVRALREQYGDWEEISSLSQDSLSEVLGEFVRGGGVGSQRVSRLQQLLTAVENTEYTDGVTLREFSRVQYQTYVDFLTEISGIQENDAWWLLQTAFDKPVWPVDSQVDTLLCSLGLIDPADLKRERGRRHFLEDKLIDRQIAPLYRALSTHAITARGDVCGETCEIRKFLLTHRLQQQKSEQEGPIAVDLFAGAGGLSCGIGQTEFNVQWAIDNDPDAVATYRFNHPDIPHENVVCGDVREVKLSQRIKQAVGSPDILVGGPPCQSLSQAGYRSRRAGDEDYSVLDDGRTTLYTQYVQTVEELRPKAIVMENVEGMVNEVGDTGVRVIDWVIEDLELLNETGLGYDVEYRVQDMAELGVPQNRERVLLLGVREDLAEQNSSSTAELLDDIPVEGETQNIQQGLSGLSRLRRGEGGRVLSEIGRGSKSDYVNTHDLDSGTNLCFNHLAREHPMEKDRILFDEALEPGDTGWDVKYGSDGEYAEYIEYDVGTAEKQRFGDKYRMLQWSEPAPTIVAHLAKDANGYVLPDYYEHVYPDEERADSSRNRGISPREAARLQSFPDDYVFLGPFTSWFRQIGNAVPPVAGKRIGQVICPVITKKEQPTTKENTPSTGEVVSDD
ncbi:DNA cytosine methyltransferase [Halorubrum sp. Atlit-28R]|uniref:DNA cytosine methyltransferase n=1 Tax=Halorubrum sp. Atlit-28R TaxID=2282129 RepID=UPI000EF1F3C1|nr:DNA cytosine methyltransferase [Halorubrum sp. Atlit-28R]RLM49881.1 DNA cytosine methyltransferase [Halorubrum sp. Atlit-28R]